MKQPLFFKLYGYMDKRLRISPPIKPDHSQKEMAV